MAWWDLYVSTVWVHKSTLTHPLSVSHAFCLSHFRSLSLPPCLPGSLAVSLQARCGNGHGNWSSVLSGRKSPAKFLSKLIKCKCKVLCLRKALTCLSDSVAWVYSTYKLILFIFNLFKISVMKLFKRQDKSIRKTVYNYRDLQNAMNLCENESLKSYLESVFLLRI